jgi:hypothetical protein
VAGWVVLAHPAAAAAAAARSRLMVIMRAVIVTPWCRECWWLSFSGRVLGSFRRRAGVSTAVASLRDRDHAEPGGAHSGDHRAVAGNADVEVHAMS